MIGRRTTAVLKGIDRRKQQESVTGELVSEVTSEKITCSVRRTEAHKCDISYKPTTLGRHRLHIKVDGEPVKGSPFPVTVSSPTQHTFSTPIKCVSEAVQGPWGIAVNGKGDVVLVETKKHCVSVFSPTGDKLQSFGEHSAAVRRHRLKSPRGVDVDSEDSILITDWDRHCLHKFTSGGQHVATVGRNGDKPLEFKNPAGIGIHPHNKKIYITEYGNHCVQILSPDLSFYGSFGCHGNGNGQFNHPYDVAFDSTGNVHITDSDNHRIQVFTAEGQFLHHIGQWGTGNGDLQAPYSIVIDRDDVVYVTEGRNYRVSKFNTRGQFLESFGIEKKRLYMNAPCGIAVGTGNSSGVLYVSDYINNCLLLFHKDFASHEINDA